MCYNYVYSVVQSVGQFFWECGQLLLAVHIRCGNKLPKAQNWLLFSTFLVPVSLVL